MNLIANENYYQRTIRELNRIELEIKQETAKMTPAELDAREQRLHKCLERAFQKYEEQQAVTVYKPDFWRRWKFDRATKMALDIAKYFGFNVRIEADEIKGQISMRGDQILLDASSWHDSKQKRQLLLLAQWAGSVWVGGTVECGVNLIDIVLRYKWSENKVSLLDEKAFCDC